MFHSSKFLQRYDFQEKREGARDEHREGVRDEHREEVRDEHREGVRHDFPVKQLAETGNIFTFGLLKHNQSSNL